MHMAVSENMQIEHTDLFQSLDFSLTDDTLVFFIVFRL